MRRRLRVSEVASRLRLSKPTVLKLLRKGDIPGGEVLYRDDGGRQHWRVDRDVFEEWEASLPRLRN